MLERLKTILLFILFGISIFLAKSLWIELPERSFSVENSKTITSYSLVEMMAPSKYLIHFDENNNTLFYDESKYTLWADARKSIKSVLESEKIEIEKIDMSDMGEYNRKRSISFEFPEKLNTYILAKALKIDQPNEIIDTMEWVDSIYIYLGLEEPFFLFIKDDEIIKVTDSQSYYKNAQVEAQNWDIISKVENIIGTKSPVVEEDIFQTKDLKDKILEIETNGKFNYYYSMREMMGTDKDLYIPYEMNNILPTVYMENQMRTMDEHTKNKLVESFFRENIDYIREVVESNGSSIYVQNQKVLKLNDNGVLEYYNHIDERVEKRSLYESLNTTSEFLSNVVGNIKGLYLADINPIEDEFGNKGYAFSFKYRVRGIPIILENAKLDDFVKMEVFNSNVKSYKQLMRKDMAKSLDFKFMEKEVKALSSFDIIDKNYDIFLKDYRETNKITAADGDIQTQEVLSSIKDITLAYYDPTMKETDEELIRVWAIKTANNMYSFDIYTGKKIDQRKV